LQAHQLKVYGKKPIRYKQTKAVKNHYRDLLITGYGQRSLKEIKQILAARPHSVVELEGKMTKEILIQRVLKDLRFIVSTDNIKKIIEGRDKRETRNRTDYM
jgi:hypothetical protein